MSNRLYHRDFLKEIDFTPEDLTYLLDLAAQLKQAKKVRREPKFLQDRNIVILFEKDSTRTRCSFEVAAYLGARSAIGGGARLIRPLFILMVLALSARLAWQHWSIGN